jgi:endo-1,4-beta-D-glucanase Y
VKAKSQWSPRGVIFLAAAAALASAGCLTRGDSTPPSGAGGGAGGQAGLGGAGATGGHGGGSGGVTGSGGAIGAGGAPGTGGRAGLGGATGSGGLAGSGGTSGAGGARPDAGDAAPVTPPGLGACLLPAGAGSADVQAAFTKWTTDLLTSDGAGGFQRVKRPNSGTINSSNSEGTGYGMEMAVYLDQQSLFDNLWKYEQLHLDVNGLMNWEITAEGAVSGAGAATDGDEDMAFALVMADKKWGGSGSLSDTYLNWAKKQIDLIWQFEVDQTRADVLAPGDMFGGSQPSGAVINISYFAPAYYRIFGQVTGKTSDWNKVAETSYDVLEATLNAANHNASNGLVPAWSTPAGVPMAPTGTSDPIDHQLDSCRTPFRIAQDYCWFNQPRALAYLQKISGFYAGVGAANILDEYSLNGTANSSDNLHLAAFVGAAGVGAMATPQYATLRDQAYGLVATPPGLLGGSLYYNESWTVLSLLMMNGAFINLTAN